MTPRQAAQPAAVACPGQPMAVQATGVYTPNPVPDIVVNGQPAPGAIWLPGMRSYWHCHGLTASSGSPRNRWG